MRRVLFFLYYDPKGMVDTSVLHTLQGFRPHAEEIVVISNGDLTTAAATALGNASDQLIVRENTGYDVGAYRHAFAAFGWEKLASFDEVLLANYTFFGPVGTFDGLFARMDGEPVDFWGITDHPAVTPHPYTGRGTMPQHLQSYWLGLRQRLVADPSFREYWESLPDPRSYNEVVTHFECEFTAHFADRGFSWVAAYPASDYGVSNSTMEAPVRLLMDGCPLFKKRLYFHDFPVLIKQGAVPSEVTRTAHSLGYPRELIVEGVRRRSTSRGLNLALGATIVIPDSASSTAEAPDRVATRVGSPWGDVVRSGVDSVMGGSDFLLCEPLSPPRSSPDRDLLRYQRAHEVAEHGDFLVAELDSDPLLGMIVPPTQYVGSFVSGRAWFGDFLNAKAVAAALHISPPFSETLPLGPYQGAALYRRQVVEAMSESIRRAGGWDALRGLVQGDDALHRILDLLAADVAKSLGYVTAEAGCAAQIGASLATLTEIYSKYPQLFAGYTAYPYSGRTLVPSRMNRLGDAVKKVSPGAFAVLHRLKLQALSLTRRG